MMQYRLIDMVKEKEIANGIYFLASDKASYITGQVLAIDGGFEATGVGLPSLKEMKVNNQSFSLFLIKYL